MTDSEHSIIAKSIIEWYSKISIKPHAVKFDPAFILDHNGFVIELAGLDSYITVFEGFDKLEYICVTESSSSVGVLFDCVDIVTELEYRVAWFMHFSSDGSILRIDYVSSVRSKGFSYTEDRFKALHQV